MNYYLLIPFFLILILFIPVKLKLKFSCNLLKQNGAFGIFIFFKKIMHQQFWLNNGKIILKDEKKTSVVEIELDSKELIFAEVFSKQIKNKTRLKELYLFYNVGLNDAFLSSMLAGYINLASLIFFTKLKNTRPTASFAVYDTVSYNRMVIELAVKMIISISLFDIVYSFILSLIITNRIAKSKMHEKIKSQKLEERWSLMKITKLFII